MSLSEQVKWTTQIGIEHTMIHAKGRVDREMQSKRNAFQVLDINDEFEDVHVDCGDVLEVPSPILRSWKQAKEWYHKVQDIAKQIDVTAFREGHVAGGGHIHIGNLREKDKWNLFADVQSRPYLSWAMIDPVDDINAKTLLRPYQIDGIKEEDEWALDWKDYILRCDHYYKTVEWRAFDSAADWEIQASHIAFIQRYVALIKKLKYKIHPINEHDEDFLNQYKNVNRCVKEFKSFITETLELPWKEYSWYVDRNLIPKLKNGWSDIV